MLTLASVADAQAVEFGNFFTTGQAQAGWTTIAGPAGASDSNVAQLTVPDTSSYAVIHLGAFPSTLPTSPPSFWLNSSVSGSSGGSPRLVIAFSNNGSVDLRPVSWTAGSWQSVSGAGANWDSAAAGGCPARENVTYQQATACYASAGVTVTSVDLTDDNSTYPGGYVHYIADLQYDGVTVGPTTLIAGFTSVKTTLSGKATVSTSTGDGTENASCRTGASSCRFALKLTAPNVAFGTIGAVSGAIAGGADGTLAVKLNALGRRTLKAKHTLRVVATGTVAGHKLTIHLTLHAG